MRQEAKKSPPPIGFWFLTSESYEILLALSLLFISTTTQTMIKTTPSTGSILAVANATVVEILNDLAIGENA